MTADYTVTLEVGQSTTTAFTIVRGQAPRIGDPLMDQIDVLDGLVHSWAMPLSDLWPVQPEPATLSFSLLALDAADLAHIDLGSPVRYMVNCGVLDALGSPIPSARFLGRVSDLNGHPRKIPLNGGIVEGWQVDIIAVDVTADLADANVAGNVNPLDTGGPFGWTTFYFNLAGVTPPDWGGSAPGGNGCLLTTPDDGEVPAETLASAVERILRNYADGGPITGDESDPASHFLYEALGWRRGVIVPNINALGFQDETTPWLVDFVSRRNWITSYLNPTQPGYLKWDAAAGLWRITIAPPPATTWDHDFNEIADVYNSTLTLDADYLAYDATWTRTKSSEPNRVIVTNSEKGLGWRKVTRTTPGVTADFKVTQLDDTRIVAIANARRLGDMYVDNDPAGVVWQAQAFRWYASGDPSFPPARGLFPDDWETSLWRGYAAPVTIVGIPPEQLPDGGRWYTGVIKGATWTFGGGEFAIDLTLHPRIPGPAGDFLSENSLTWQQLDEPNAHAPGTYPRPLWTTLDPVDTWIDYRLARPIHTDYTLGP